MRKVWKMEREKALVHLTVFQTLMCLNRILRVAQTLAGLGMSQVSGTLNSAGCLPLTARPLLELNHHFSCLELLPAAQSKMLTPFVLLNET